MTPNNNLSPARVHEFSIERLSRERIKPAYAEMLILDSDNFIEIYDKLSILNIFDSCKNDDQLIQSIFDKVLGETK